jgi:hypothetical protein
MESLNEWPAFPEREWLNFTPNKVRVALAACVKNSAPGPDHITWSHLKLLLADVETYAKVVDIANACFEHGHWPTFFKESLLVIIPKPGKPSYAAPKAFRPIVLLNTMGKLIDKCVSNRILFFLFLFFIFNNLYTGAQRQTGLYLSTRHYSHSHECPAIKVKICPEMSWQLPQITRTAACATFHG